MTPAIAPFRLEGGTTGVLLVHGFTGTPADMRALGDHLHEQGFTVRCPLLPGHGTEPGELNRVRWRDWYETARRELAELRERCTRVFVGGLSMGGAISLHLAAHLPVDGVFTLATGLRPKDWRIPFVGLIKHLKRFEPKRGGEDIKDPLAKGQFQGYQVWPTWGVHELVKLNHHVREDLPDISCPMLVMHAVDDHTVPVADADIIHDESGSLSKRKVILRDSYHVITLDYDRERVKAEVAGFIRSVVDACGERAAA